MRKTNQQKNMKRKLLLIFVLLGAVSYAANAQLTTGTPSAKKIVIGNRPQAGDFGVYTGISSTDIVSLVGGTAAPLPMVNVKYYVTDRLEARVGIDVAAARKWGNGIENSSNEKLSERAAESWAYIAPGIAYHFTKHNIIDVYAGAEIPLGYYGYRESEYDGSSDVKAISSSINPNIGLRPFIGLQAFIADLPIAIGLEYGWTGSLSFGEKVKNTIISGGSKQVTYTPLDTSTTFNKLRAGSTLLGNEIRLTVAYYFK